MLQGESLQAGPVNNRFMLNKRILKKLFGLSVKGAV